MIDQKKLHAETLPAVCMRLRMAVVTFADNEVPTMSKEDIIAIREYLEMRLRNWREGSPRARVFDESVRSMIAAVLAETAHAVKG